MKKVRNKVDHFSTGNDYARNKKQYIRMNFMTVKNHMLIGTG